MSVRVVRVLSALIGRELEIEVRGRGGPKDQTESGESQGQRTKCMKSKKRDVESSVELRREC